MLSACLTRFSFGDSPLILLSVHNILFHPRFCSSEIFSSESPGTIPLLLWMLLFRSGTPENEWKNGTDHVFPTSYSGIEGFCLGLGTFKITVCSSFSFTVHFFSYLLHEAHPCQNVQYIFKIQKDSGRKKSVSSRLMRVFRFYHKIGITFVIALIKS